MHCARAVQADIAARLHVYSVTTEDGFMHRRLALMTTDTPTVSTCTTTRTLCMGYHNNHVRKESDANTSEPAKCRCCARAHTPPRTTCLTSGSHTHAFQLRAAVNTPRQRHVLLTTSRDAALPVLRARVLSPRAYRRGVYVVVFFCKPQHPRRRTRPASAREVDFAQLIDFQLPSTSDGAA